MKTLSITSVFTQLKHGAVSLHDAARALVDLEIAKSIDEVHHVARTTPSLDEKVLAFEDLLLLEHNCQLYHVFQTVEVDKTEDHQLIADSLEAFGHEVSAEQVLTMVENIEKREGHAVGWPEFLQSFSALEQKAPAKHAIFTQWLKMTPDLNSAFATLQQKGRITLELASLVLAQHGDVKDRHKVRLVADSLGIPEHHSLELADFKYLHKACRLRKVFEEMDTDGSGGIESEELARALAKLGRKLTAQQVATLMTEVDNNGDGEVSFTEFIDFFRNVEAAELADLASIADQWMCAAGMDVVPPPNMPLWQFLLAGGLGGVCARTITAPLEKVTIQAQTGNLSAGGGTAAELRSTFRLQGLRGLFAGNAANCARVFPFGATVCLSYGNLLKVLPSHDLTHSSPWEPMWRFIAGSGAGALATLPTYPLDLIRTKMAIQTESKDERRARKARSGSSRGCATILSVGRQIVAHDGWRGLYRGLVPTLATVVPLVGLQQMTYDVCRHTAVSMGAEPSPQLAVACGAAAGVVSQGVVYPMDLLRRRVQVQASTAIAPASSAPASSAIALQRELSWSARQSARGWRTVVAFRQVVAELGVRGLFAGITPSILRVMPAVAANVTMRDTVLGRLG